LLKLASRLAREAAMFFEKNPHAGETAQGLSLASFSQEQLSATQPSPQAQAEFPPGILGCLAQFIYEQAPYPNKTIALAGAVGMMAGLSGRAFNTYTGAGLNQYILVLASTGAGKEAMADGISKLMLAVRASVPAITDFKGPAHFASAQGLLRALAKSPCFVSIIGEFGLKFRALASPKASPNDVALKAALLDLFGKSGQGKLLDPMAYSDTARNTATIESPALSIIGESTPESFFEAIDDGVIADGLLPRFLVFLAPQKRPYLNADAVSSPPPALVQSLADLAAICLHYAHSRQAVIVNVDSEAAATFMRFERWTTDQINEGNSEASRQLWNRANLKAQKLASLCAVGVNPTAPSVTNAEAMWATNLIAEQTHYLLARFAKGEVGEVAGNEAKQISEVIRIVGEYYKTPYGPRLEKYGCCFEMHRQGVITEAYISRRLITLPTFRPRATEAIKRAIKTLMDADELREMPKSQMLEKFGKGPRAFVVSNPARFINV
jgi:hypothetical protein